jgi:hypothetical protein
LKLFNWRLGINLILTFRTFDLIGRWSVVGRAVGLIDVRCSIFDVRFSIFDVRCSMLDVRFSMFDVRFSMFDVRFDRSSRIDLVFASWSFERLSGSYGRVRTVGFGSIDVRYDRCSM